MADHPIEDPKAYDQQLRQIETSDDVHPDVVNPLFKQLINNDAYLREQITEIEEQNSNQNGSYIRYKDGLQVCYAYGKCYFYEDNGSPFVFGNLLSSGSAAIDWTFPASFTEVFGSPSFSVRGLMTNDTDLDTGTNAMETNYLIATDLDINFVDITIGNTDITFYDDQATGSYVGVALYGFVLGRWK